MTKEIKLLSLNKLSFKFGITMLILVIILEILKASRNMENMFQIMAIYYVFMALIYLFGISVLIILALNLSEISQIHKSYFIYSVVSIVFLAFLWLPNYNIVLSIGQLSTLSQNSSLNDVFDIGNSFYYGIQDINNLRTAMYIFFVNGVIHWLCGYFMSPQEVHNINENKITKLKFDNFSGRNRKKVQVNVTELYQLINKKNIKNRLHSRYWIFDIESVIRKENEISKRYLKIKLFNRFLDENDALMRIYLKVNGEDVYSDVLETIPEYYNPCVKGIILERDLAEEKFEVEITGYIVNGSRENVAGEYIDHIAIDTNSRRLAAIKERFFNNHKEKCKVVPSIKDNYWLCTCGFINDIRMDNCLCCNSQKNIIKKIEKFSENDLLKDISQYIPINTRQTIDEIVEEVCRKYKEEFNISESMTKNSLDREILKSRQKRLISKEIDKILKEKPINFIMDLSYEENIEGYCKKNAKGVITKEDVYNQINHIEWKQNYESNKVKKKQKK